jgi:hypothetical protein
MKKLILIIFLCYAQPYFSVAQTEDRWYTLTIGSKPSGYYHETIINSDSIVTNRNELIIRISRLGSETVLDAKQSVTEDRRGNMTNFTSELLYSKQLITSKAIILPGVVRLTSQAGGKESTRDIPYSGKLTGNEGIRVLTIENLKRPGDSISYQLFLSEFGMVSIGKRKFIAFENISLNGTNIKAKKVKESFVGFPTVRDLWLDDHGRLLKSSEPSPFGETIMMLSNKATAIALYTMKIELSEDQYSATIARANVRFPQPRQMESVTIKITQNKGGAGMPDFNGSYQEVLEKKDNYVILKINKPVIGKIKELLTASEKAEYLESGYYIDKDDTVAQRLAKEITSNEKNAWQKVVLLRDWVNVNMKFNAGIVMAPSSEAIRNLEGTCVSYATVLTTLCRAADIPARYLMGFVYFDGMWGGHAWVEVYINDSWIPVDAAAPSPGGIADAARFYFMRNSVKNGMGEFMIGGSQLYSNVSIETLSYTVNGHTSKASNSLYEVNAFQYSNPGLGITMKSMKGFKFSAMDKVYPESILFSLKNQAAQQAIDLYIKFSSPRSSAKDEIRKHVSNSDVIQTTTYQGADAFQSETPTKTVLAIPNGNDIYLFVSTGPGATENLKKAMRGFAFQKF